MLFFKESEREESWFWEVKGTNLQGMYKLEIDRE